jgi:hypothetical protein
MKLYERFGDRGFHTSLITTFCVDFEAYENIVLPRLRGAGCHNNIVLADNAMLGDALDNGLALPRYAGRWYTASGIKAVGVFHPKLLLQLGRNDGRLIISSANMTTSGLAGNLELAGGVICTDAQSAEQSLITQVWRYAANLLRDCGQASEGQLAWAETRTPWLRRASPATGPVTLQDGTIVSFLATGSPLGIGERFVQQIGDDPVKRLIVFSPFWDDKLEALKNLVNRIKPNKIALLIDPSARAFPADALTMLKGAQLFDAQKFCKGRFFHAKAIIAQTKKSDHVLYGSANCTVAALGKTRFAGTNEEACLYKRLPAGSVLDALGLETMLDKQDSFDPATLDIESEVEDGTLLDQAKGAPGRFECQFDILIWKPPISVGADKATIELLNADSSPLECHLTPVAERDDGCRRYQLSEIVKRPAFARLRYEGGGISTPAIVTLIDQIREVAREQRSKQADQAATRLGSETEVELWVLEIFDTLEAAEAKLNDEAEPTSFVSRRKGDDKEVGENYRTLSYESFIAGRKHASEHSSLVHNSLVGSDLSLVRGFLNRILGMADTLNESGSDEDDLKNAFNLGDEVGNADAVMDAGDLLEGGPTALSPEDEVQTVLRQEAAQRKATREQIAQAAIQFGKRIAQRKSAKALNTLDILRLRALLMIITAAGLHGRGAANEGGIAPTSLQVLPLEGSDDSWPRILGRLLFGVFGGPDPAIRYVRIEVTHDQIADDILESWATCFWCVQAAFIAPRSVPERKMLAKHIGPLMDKIYRCTGLVEIEFMSKCVLTVMERMSDRFCERLGLDSQALKDAHSDYVSALFKD